MCTALGSDCVRCYSLTSPEKLFEYYSIPNYIRYISVCKQTKNVVGVNVQKAFAMYYSHVLAQIWYSLCFSALWRCFFFLFCVSSTRFCSVFRFVFPLIFVVSRSFFLVIRFWLGLVWFLDGIFSSISPQHCF